jgi:hypothetical protein
MSWLPSCSFDAIRGESNFRNDTEMSIASNRGLIILHCPKVLSLQLTIGVPEGVGRLKPTLWIFAVCFQVSFISQGQYNSRSNRDVLRAERVDLQLSRGRSLEMAITRCDIGRR